MPEEDMEISTDLGQPGFAEDIDIDIDFAAGQADEDLELADFDQGPELQNFNSDGRDELMGEGDDASFGMVDADDVDQDIRDAVLPANDIEIDLGDEGEGEGDGSWTQETGQAHQGTNNDQVEHDENIDYVDHATIDDPSKAGESVQDTWPEPQTHPNDIGDGAGTQNGREDTDASNGALQPQTNVGSNENESHLPAEHQAQEGEASGDAPQTSADPPPHEEQSNDAKGDEGQLYDLSQEGKDEYNANPVNDGAAIDSFTDEVEIQESIANGEEIAEGASADPVDDHFELEDHVDTEPHDQAEEYDDGNIPTPGPGDVDKQEDFTEQEAENDPQDNSYTGSPPHATADIEDESAKDLDENKGQEAERFAGLENAEDDESEHQGQDFSALAVRHETYISYGQTDYRLFAQSEDDDPNQYFLDDKSVLNLPLGRFLSTLRDVISEEISPLDELVMHVDGLGLEFSEVSPYTLQPPPPNQIYRN